MLKKATPYLILTAIAVLVFSGGLLSTTNEIVSYDNKPLEARVMSQQLAGSVGNWGWMKNAALGSPANPAPPTLRLLAVKAFSPVFYLKFMYFISILLGGIFFYLFLRDFKLLPSATLFGAVSWMLTNTVITLILPGHLGKLMALSCFPLAFLFLRRAVRLDAWSNYVYSGLFVGMSFLLGAYQMSFYFGLLLFFYWIYLMQKKRGEQKIIPYVRGNWKKIGCHKVGLLVAGFLILITAASVLPSIFRHTQTRTTEKSSRTATQKWHWATRWSVTPGDLPDIIIPGLNGWKTGDPKYPYIGPMGRSADGGKTQRNLKLAVDYLGLITFFFVIAGLFIVWKEKELEHRFWLGAMLTALALALGKYLYLPYYLFYSLPYMDTIRNPNKFMKVFAFSGVMLASFGFHRVFSRREGDRKKIAAFTGFLKWSTLSLAGLSVLSLLFNSTVQRFLENNGAGSNAAKNIAGYWPVAFLIAATLSAAVWYTFRQLLPGKNGKATPLLKYAPWALIILSGAELWYSADHFLTHRPTGDRYEPNALTSVFEKPGIPNRVFFLTHPNIPQSFAERFRYQNLNLLSFNDLMQPEVSRSQALAAPFSRPLYQLVVAAANNSLTNLRAHEKGLKYLKVAGVTHLVAFGDLKSPGLKKIRAFRVQQNRPLLTVYQYTGAIPRVSVQHRYRVFKTPEEAAAHIASSNYSISDGICLDREGLSMAGNPILPNQALSTNKPVSSIASREYKNNRIDLEVYSSAPGFVLIQDQFHKEWQAEVNGKKTAIIPANVFARSIPIPAGKSRVILRFTPPTLPLNLTLAGYGIALFVFMGELLMRRRKKKHPSAE